MKFPEGFLWGAATSAHQVEGNTTHNDWWEAEQAARVPFQSGRACNQYELFERDFDLAKSLNHNAHRLSIEWSRIEPKEGMWDEKEIEHYRTVLLALKNRGLKSFVTLHHFTNPLWFAKKGGWNNAHASAYFVRYVKTVVERFGDLIGCIITINEPLVYMGLSYREGRWPPFHKNDFWSIVRVFRAMVQAHRQAYAAIKMVQQTIPVGIAANLIDFQPRHKWNPVDWLISWSANYFWNDLFLKQVSRHMDFIGVNYYFHHHVHTMPFFGYSLSGHSFSDLGWGIHPEGLYWVVKNMRSYRKPIYITENGIADAKDEKRTEFIVNHLRFLYQNIREGCDVRGYFYWSLTDNFEWADGFWPRFGLADINYETFERGVRPSAKVYQEICAINGIPQNLMK